MDDADDPGAARLVDLFQQLREALAPLGVYVDPGLILLWEDARHRRCGLFTRTGDFTPAVAERFLEFASALEAMTAKRGRAAR
jgi:hypothetical protein